jgi:hypothetical protein
MHPMHSCQACNDGKIQHADKGPISDTGFLLPGTRFNLDFGFIRASSADFGVMTGNHVLTSYDSNNSYLIIVCDKTRQTWVFCQASKLPPIFIIERFLASNGLKSGPRYLRMDQGEELWRSNDLLDVAFAAGYDFEPTGSDAASENGKFEQANGTFGALVRCLLYSDGLHTRFWSAALVHDVYLKNHLYHKALCMTPHEAWTGEKPSLAHLLTFGALVTARKPGKRPAKADCHADHGVLLGYGSIPKHVRYFDQMTNREKLSTNHTIDEAHYGTTNRPPGPHILMDMGYDQEHVLPALITVPPKSHYPLRSRHNFVSPLLCKLLPLPMNEFTSAPVAVIASVSASDINRNISVTVTFSTDPFGKSFPETVIVSVIHPMFGLILHYDVDRHRCRLINMDLGTPSHSLPRWKSCLHSAYILSIDTMSVHTIADIGLVISEARTAGRPSIVVVFTKDDALNCLSEVGLPQLYFDQLRIMRGHIDNTVLAVVHKAITGPKFNRRTLQKQLDWNDWLAAEWIQLDNYDKQEMFGYPCTAPVDASVFFWVWLYSIKPH